jgi:pimeloyl-ACP methyl ester carboxylesterase
MKIAAQEKRITTNIGTIAVYIKESSSDNLPIIFLHGVYFDHHLWNNQIQGIDDRTVISVDMPLHGNSRGNIKANWTLTDCSDMLIDILDSLQIPQVIALGHSWGSMTILRAAHKYPQRFASIGLCNMPFQAASKKQKAIFELQHSMLAFRKFYTKQAAKALFGRTSLQENPSLIMQLERPMSILSNKQIRQIDKAVIMCADDATDLIKTLKVKAIALKGKEDYVPAPPNIRTIVIKGGHVSPVEQPSEVFALIGRLVKD